MCIMMINLTISARALMTLPRVVKLLLMLAPSLRRVPLAPVESARSEPARSTNDILLTFSVANPVEASCRSCVKNIVKTAWDLLDVSFIFVAATVLIGKWNEIFKTFRNNKVWMKEKLWFNQPGFVTLVDEIVNILVGHNREFGKVLHVGP